MSGMSAGSSSNSWSGDGCEAPDIIDLDKYMRGTVRPPRRSHTQPSSKQLVVDSGGVERKIPVLGTHSGVGHPKMSRSVPKSGSPVNLRKNSSSTDSSSVPHNKHYSHDSGLSDGSYNNRRHRPHSRRVAPGDSGRVAFVRQPGSNDSLRAFRTVCERALQDQQAQIARVADLCQRMTSRRNLPASATSSLHSSEVTSSSRSTKTKDIHRKDRHRTDECKTYKIIMNKLDELNELFAARSRTSKVMPKKPSQLLPRSIGLSSGSVSVSDKLVATEPSLLQGLQFKSLTETMQIQSETNRISNPVINTCRVEAAPVPLGHQQLVSRCLVNAEDAGEQRLPPFDLDDPIHLYSQAKRLEVYALSGQQSENVRGFTRLAEHSSSKHQTSHGYHDKRDTSLCALCRGYWRSLRQYFANQIFSGADDDR